MAATLLFPTHANNFLGPDTVNRGQASEDLTSIALSLRDRINLGPKQRFRLVGVGLSNFRDSDNASAQPVLFETSVPAAAPNSRRALVRTCSEDPLIGTTDLLQRVGLHAGANLDIFWTNLFISLTVELDRRYTPSY